MPSRGEMLKSASKPRGALGRPPQLRTLRILSRVSLWDSRRKLPSPLISSPPALDVLLWLEPSDSTSLVLTVAALAPVIVPVPALSLLLVILSLPFSSRCIPAVSAFFLLFPLRWRCWRSPLLLLLPMLSLLPFSNASSDAGGAFMQPSFSMTAVFTQRHARTQMQQRSTISAIVTNNPVRSFRKAKVEVLKSGSASCGGMA
mgnify:CR=1 FL=1